MKPFLALLLSSFVIAHSSFAAERRPNVLLIVSDDQGCGDFGFTGNKVVKTPHLDRLAAESAVFKNFVVAPACSPTRSSLFTGRQHLLTGTWGVGPRANMLRDEVRMPRYFQTAGYATGFFGKRDSIHWLEQDAWDLGCDEFEGVWGYDHLDPRMFTRNGVVEKKGWTCDIDVDNALSFIKRQGGNPGGVRSPSSCRICRGNRTSASPRRIVKRDARRRSPPATAASARWTTPRAVC